MKPDDTDEALMARYARGDVGAFECLYRRHELRVWRYLQRNVRNHATADELLQEVWFAVARDAPRYQPTARFTSWLYSIAHHRMIDSIRADRPHASLESLMQSSALPPGFAADMGPGPLAQALALDEMDAMLDAISSLPQEQREAFLLQVEGDLSVGEIAAITNTSFETAKSRLRYARSKLRELLKEHA
jgi:RNA polymerase sigma-70 factor (ECF subfamily)